MTAQEKLTTNIETMTTEQLREVAIRMNTMGTTESIIVCTYVDRELERRLPEAEFTAFMEELEAMLDLAA